VVFKNTCNNILIIRLSAIGDIVMSSCIASGLKAAHPQAKISWLVQKGMENLLDANPAVDEVIVWPRGQWQGLWKQRRFVALFREIRQFVATLRQRNFTVAIDAQGLLKSAVWAWLSGAKKRIGLNSREGSGRFMTEVHYAPHSKKISSEYLHLLDVMQAGKSPVMSVVTIAEDHANVSDLLRSSTVNRPYVIFCPFSTREQKNWTTEHWVRLAQLIDEQLAMDCVILGAPADGEQAKLIAQQSTNLYELTGKTSLRQAAALIEQASGLVGVDTGLTHIGVLNNAPTVAIFGSTCPYLYSDSMIAKVIYKNLECAPCKRNPTCDGKFSCMQDITPAEVLAELKVVLAS
jgi:heptosyltransferase-1